MGGTRLEVFKFGIYIFVPIAVMYVTGVPEFVEREVLPLRRYLLHTDESLQTPPQSAEEIKRYIAELRQRRGEKRSDVHE